MTKRNFHKQSLMGILQDEEALSFIKKAPTKEDIRKFVSEKLQIA